MKEFLKKYGEDLRKMENMSEPIQEGIDPEFKIETKENATEYNKMIIRDHNRDQQIISEIRRILDILNQLSIECSYNKIYFELKTINSSGAIQWTSNIYKIL